MAKITSGQHFVPRTYLKHFAERNKQGTNQITCFHNDLTTPYYKTNIENVCQQNHLYTIEIAGASKKQRDLLDEFYENNFENDYNQIFNILTDETIFKITKEQKNKIIGTVISMYFRVAKWLNTSKTIQKAAIKHLVKISKEIGNYDVKLNENNYWNIKNKSVEELLNELKYDRKLRFYIFQLKGYSDLIKKRSNDKIIIYKSFGDDEFITSDVPITLNNNIAELSTNIISESHIMLHISPKYCLTIIPNDKENLELIRVDMDSANSKLYSSLNNHNQFRNSERYILGTNSGIIKYLRIRDDLNDKEYINEMRSNAKESLNKLLLAKRENK